MMMYAAKIIRSRRYALLWFYAVVLDHFVQAASVMCVAAVPFAVFASPDLSGVASIILAITGLVTVVGGMMKVRSEQDQKRREWDYDHPPRDPRFNHRRAPDSNIDEDQPAASADPGDEPPKKQRVRRRRTEKDKDSHDEATPP